MTTVSSTSRPSTVTISRLAPRYRVLPPMAANASAARSFTQIKTVGREFGVHAAAKDAIGVARYQHLKEKGAGRAPIRERAPLAGPLEPSSQSMRPLPQTLQRLSPAPPGLGPQWVAASQQRAFSRRLNGADGGLGDRIGLRDELIQTQRTLD